MIEVYIIIATIFFVLGMVVGKKFLVRKEELDTDTAVAYLKSKGYYVNLKVFQTGEN